MELSSGVYRGVTWTRYGWGIELVTYVTGERVRRRYVGNGSDRVTVRGSVSDLLNDLRAATR